MLIRLVDNMDAGFSLYSAAVLGCSYLQSLEKEQKFANLTSIQSYIYHKNQTADVKGNLRNILQMSLYPRLYFIFVC